MTDSSQTLYCAGCLTTFDEVKDSCPNMGCGKPRPELGWGRMFQPGEVMDRNYRVEKTLALGGAGVTYLVREIDEGGKETGPKIALKLLFASRDHGAYLQRLSTEAQILQQLDHPNIVQYLGFVHRTGHSPYLLTRFEEGGSLLDHMRRVGTLSIKAAARIGRQVCWALDKGHSRDIIHRDLKPENMLLTQVVKREDDPVVRVADFGIAKVQGSLGAGLTRTGAFVGTPQYAAPEQFVGDPATAATDVYSLGAVLVFLMTARPVVPKAHLSAPEDVYLKLQDQLPATVDRAKDSAVDNARMNTILAHAMQADPKARCTVDQMDQMLKALLDDQDPEVAGSHTMGTDSGASGPALKSLPPIQAPELEYTEVDPITPNDDAGSHEVTGDLVESVSPLETPVSATQTHDPPPQDSGGETLNTPKSSGGSRWGWRLVKSFLVLVFLTVLGGAGSLWWVVQKAPWHLDEIATYYPEGLPKIVGDPPVSIIRDPSPSAQAKRKKLKPILRRVIKGYWSGCGDIEVPKKIFFLELVVEPDGKIRWIRPVNDEAPGAHHCVTEEMSGESLFGWTSANPIRARVKVEYNAK